MLQLYGNLLYKNILLVTKNYIILKFWKTKALPSHNVALKQKEKQSTCII